MDCSRVLLFRPFNRRHIDIFAKNNHRTPTTTLFSTMQTQTRPIHIMYSLESEIPRTRCRFRMHNAQLGPNRRTTIISIRSFLIHILRYAFSNLLRA